MKKKQKASQEEIQKLYEPEAFYEHGDNPVLKKFMSLMVENMRQGKLPDYRTYVVEKYTKFHYARNWEDFLQQDLKIITFPRSIVAFTYATWLFLLSSRYARNFLPVGQHGITKVSQTQFYHLYGPIGTLAVLGLPAAGEYPFGLYLWWKTAKFTAEKFYYHVLLGERNTIYEWEKSSNGAQEYFFSDAPWSSDESFPELGRGEMSKKKIPKPEWATWK